MRIEGPIPDRILKMMDPKDRPKGVPGMTSSEIRSVAVDKAEKELQQEIVNYLNFKRIKFINPAMHKKSGLPKGWPDFTILFTDRPAVFWECKRIGGALRPEQITHRDELQSLGFEWRLIRHLGEAKAHLDELGGVK